MSSIPPEPPGAIPPPPPPGGPDLATGLPWENRAQLGLGPAFVETVKLVVTNPEEAFRRMREKGDLFEALLFGIVPAWVGMAFSSLWLLTFQPGWLTTLPRELRDAIGPVFAMGIGSFVMTVILAPVYITVLLFIGAGILHVCLMIVGGLKDSRAGFEGTFRTICYSNVAHFAQLVPFIGGLIAAIWRLILLVIGFAAVHRTTRGRALGALLIPLVLCCGCAILVVIAGVAAIASLLHR